MKKINKIFTIIVSFVFIFILSFASFPIKNASANTNQNTVLNAEFYQTVNNILNSYVKFDNRTPGSDNEKAAADYIISYLNNNTNCKPLENDFIKDGTQSFKFKSILDEKYHTSQNIIYTHISKNIDENKKKVVIACSYDAIAFKFGTYQMERELVASESVNESAGSVALLLALARYLSIQDFSFDIEFIFFGAGTSNNAGSDFYVNGIGEEEANEIALMINLDKVSLGKNIYYYVDEVENDFSKYFSNLSNNKNFNIKQILTSNIGKVLLSTPNEIGLNYEHIALNSNNIKFMGAGVLTLNFFAGDYSSGVTLGLSEYKGQDILTYTDNDSLSYISELYGESEIPDNLFTVYNSINNLLNDSEFLGICEKTANSNNIFYNIITNQRLIAYISAIAMMIFIAVVFIINYKLTKQSYYSNIEIEFVKTVVRISDNIGGDETSTEVPEVISELLVRDIKKDKRLKKNKKKK